MCEDTYDSSLSADVIESHGELEEVEEGIEDAVGTNEDRRSNYAAAAASRAASSKHPSRKATAMSRRIVSAVEEGYKENLMPW